MTEAVLLSRPAGWLFPLLLTREPWPRTFPPLARPAPTLHPSMLQSPPSRMSPLTIPPPGLTGSSAHTALRQVSARSFVRCCSAVKSLSCLCPKHPEENLRLPDCYCLPPSGLITCPSHGGLRNQLTTRRRTPYGRAARGCRGPGDPGEEWGPLAAAGTAAGPAVTWGDEQQCRVSLRDTDRGASTHSRNVT